MLVERALPDTARRKGNVRVWIKPILSLAALLTLLLLLGKWWRPELEALGHGFVGRFGWMGFALGVFLADACHFPLPAQFYMLLSIAAGKSAAATLLSISVGSVVGGLVGYGFGRRVSQLPRVRSWLTRGGRGLEQHVQGKNAYRSAVLLSLSPFAYSVLCALSGVYRLPLRAFLVVLALRLPKLIGYYALIKFGWGY
jgi:membrane protein YqaA with SNARE-associated domain